ncbi:MAG: hypothetical protein A2Y34_07790 [Spirochaetes bacterium GWC1_27_15]|nr:MAG: hypothetical protein A2Z98_17055 [Spirochaetes bacterium GWB1_27_13]OHD21072.1 MAG: hypothetical protein A2Y34_07790 [Spirochaetes bacterium GWC1_27_15]
MKKVITVLLYVSLIVNLSIGLVHFFVPNLENLYSAIPDTSRHALVALAWINFFFSLFLTGLSLILLISVKKILDFDYLGIILYGFMGFVWFCKVILTIMLPWNEKFDLTVQIQVITAIFIFAIFLIPFSLLLLDKIKQFVPKPTNTFITQNLEQNPSFD